MATAIGSITRSATRGLSEPLNILTFPVHERYQSGLAGTNAVYYLLQHPSVKSWNTTYAPVPENHILLNPSRGEKQIPPDIDFDIVLSQNKFGNFQLAERFARELHLPLVSLEHTLPVPHWSPEQLASLKRMRGDLNVFISQFSVGEWGWNHVDPSVRVVHHGVDTDTFAPGEETTDRQPHLLSVVNDWVNRDWCCGYKLWQDVTRELPVAVVGATPGLSEPAKSVADLADKYRSARVFVNTSLISPVPTALLEAMACGCAVVTTGTAMIPEVIENGVNGLMSNDPTELRAYCQLLLSDEALARRLGEQARRTILGRFSMDAFVNNWNRLFAEAADVVYTGEK